MIEQNTTAQENIRRALVDAYANAVNTRKYVKDIIQKRTSTINALIASYDTYDDIISKSLKGIEFYTKLETNVSKLLQRIKSACKVQQEERDQMLLKNEMPKVDNPLPPSITPAAPKLKDYLDSRRKTSNPTNLTGSYADQKLQYPQQLPNMGYTMNPTIELPPGIRPTPLGSEVTDTPKSINSEPTYNYPTNLQYNYNQEQMGYSQYPQYYQQPQHQLQPQQSTATNTNQEQDLINRMSNLLKNSNTDVSHHQQQEQPNSQQYSSYIPQNYTPATTYSFQPQSFSAATPTELNYSYDATKAYTTTINSYRPLSVALPNTSTTHMQYPDSSLQQPSSNDQDAISTNQYPSYSSTNYTPTIHTTTQSTPQNINIYYPMGYSPHYTGTPTQTSQMFPDQVQYHSLEYATSVSEKCPPKSYNSIYSSPIVNMTSAQARDQNDYISANANYGGTDQNASGNSSNQNAQQGYVYPTGGTVDPSGYPNGSYQASTIPTSSASNAISSSQTYLSQNMSYPTNISAAYSNNYAFPASYTTANAYSADGTTYPVASTYSGYSVGTSAVYQNETISTFNNSYYPNANPSGSTQTYPGGGAVQQISGYENSTSTSTYLGADNQSYALGGTTAAYSDVGVNAAAGGTSAYDTYQVSKLFFYILSNNI